MFSASSAQRVEVCPPSEVLPQVLNIGEAADQGSAGHEHMHLRASHGVDFAVEELDRTMARWNVEEHEAGFLRSRLLRFEWSPPAGALTEVRLALMPDFSVRRVPADQRYYPGAIFTGQFDVMWTEGAPLLWKGDDGQEVTCPEDATLWVMDYKFGNDAWVHTIEANLQVGIYAYMAAKWTGAKQVVPGTIFPGPGDGDWDVDRVWGERQIEAMGERIRVLLAGVARNRLKLVAAEPLELTTGRHCLYCPARTHCPAKTALFKSVIDEGVPALGDAPLTPKQAEFAAIALPELERAARDLKELLQGYVRENGAIPVGDGVVWGPEQGERDEIISAAAREVLEQELGREYTEEAFRASISKKSIEDAVRHKHDDEGIKRRLRPTMGRIISKLKERGAIMRKPRETWCAHRPAAASKQIEIDAEGEEA